MSMSKTEAINEVKRTTELERVGDTWVVRGPNGASHPFDEYAAAQSWMALYRTYGVLKLMGFTADTVGPIQTQVQKLTGELYKRVNGALNLLTA